MLCAKAIATRLGQSEDIRIVDANGAGGWSGDPGNEIEERGLPGAAAAPENGASPGRERELLDVEHLEICTVVERK